MTELAKLLSSLHATPDDDLLWLAVADCLEEGGEPGRGELLRLCRRLREMPEDDERWRVEDRVRELVNGGVRPCVPEITNSIGMRFAFIPPGSFWMGSPQGEGNDWERPRHRVTLTRPLWMGVLPVTQAQYERVTGSNPTYFSKKGGGKAKVRKLDTASFPVEQVSWDDAVAFCEKLSSLPEEIALGHSYRLPSEAEWEYSCRGGLLSKAFHVGDTLDESQANIHESGLGRTCAVGSYPSNTFGLHDMHGQVWEWCADLFGDYEAGPAVDPLGPGDGSGRVIRGGGWRNSAGLCRAAFRHCLTPASSNFNLGLRLARVPVGG
jgi:uncharacterized protein (TIGR02996 family)